ncbi:hypothetical protein C8J27_11066 [Rhodobacter aestuarii]|uniref:Uncharacterized protein n=1 Tax=Rhodobacter aestuarii TaxID=453582 RepID=A0A1N7Q1U9_9RHOB|nr:hypothetical protein [Rhodobacter aestuarii]PTV94015.1 hypothetical protein C8J27_11066 [Rhodobacter aestuarii]SIT16577.1 hypothetical protein SAMN05421580_11266 [Rhodobacter aestuarii]
MSLMIVWPKGFLQTPKKQSWTGSPFETRAIFSPEVGAPLYRARTTAEAWTFRGIFPLADEAERAAFWAFWAETYRGVLDFLWRDPADGKVRRWKFAAQEPVSETNITGLHWDISVQVIRLPSTPWWAWLMPEGPLVAPLAAYDIARGLFHNGTAQIGQTAAIGDPLAPGLAMAHGLCDVRIVFANGTVSTLFAVDLSAGWWPEAASYADISGIGIFEAGALGAAPPPSYAVLTIGDAVVVNAAGAAYVLEQA